MKENSLQLQEALFRFSHNLPNCFKAICSFSCNSDLAVNCIFLLLPTPYLLCGKEFPRADKLEDGRLLGVTF